MKTVQVMTVWLIVILCLIGPPLYMSSTTEATLADPNTPAITTLKDSIEAVTWGVDRKWRIQYGEGPQSIRDYNQHINRAAIIDNQAMDKKLVAAVNKLQQQMNAVITIIKDANDVADPNGVE